ncbi:MAG: hypothetical protein MJ180_04310 [Candidatus Gastranaerophilales bacterium]|nr:hypothetical protein [Candidatus Gastranaerophilales bacterium]
MERSMTDEEWQEEMLMMQLRKRGIIGYTTPEEAQKHLQERIAEAEKRKSENFFQKLIAIFKKH